MAKHAMRINDVEIDSFVQPWERTEALYIPVDVWSQPPLSAQPTHILMRGLCAKSGGKIDACRSCPGVCGFGQELLKREAGT